MMKLYNKVKLNKIRKVIKYINLTIAIIANAQIS